MPLVEMLETMRRLAMKRIDLRKKIVKDYKGKFSLKVTKMIAFETKYRKNCKSIPGPTGEFEVSEDGIRYAVDMRAKTCSCRRWDLTGIPCRHALRVVLDQKKRYKTDNLVSDWYLTSKWQHQYSDSIKPVRGIKFWIPSGESTIQAPPREISKGHKKKPQQRIKGVNKSPKKGKKVTGHNRVMHCSRCGSTEHSCTNCSNDGVPCKPRPPKKQKTTTSHDEVAVDPGEGPSQT